MNTDDSSATVREEEISQELDRECLALVKIWNRMDMPPPCTPKRAALVDAWTKAHDAITILRALILAKGREEE